MARRRFIPIAELQRDERQAEIAREMDIIREQVAEQGSRIAGQAEELLRLDPPEEALEILRDIIQGGRTAQNADDLNLICAHHDRLVRAWPDWFKEWCAGVDHATDCRQAG